MFVLLPWESAQEFDDLVIDLKSEYRPRNRTELILVERMAQHHWLRNRATMLQGNCFLDDGSIDDKRLALYLRYETTHERAFHKCLNELLKLRAESFNSWRKIQECGYCSSAWPVHCWPRKRRGVRRRAVAALREHANFWGSGGSRMRRPRRAASLCSLLIVRFAMARMHAAATPVLICSALR